MTADVVNLRRARKAKLRAEKADDVAANRLLHGRTRSERDGTTLERVRAERRLDAHLLNSPADGDAS